jgi:hypothetical protein
MGFEDEAYRFSSVLCVRFVDALHINNTICHSDTKNNSAVFQFSSESYQVWNLHEARRQRTMSVADQYID